MSSGLVVRRSAWRMWGISLLGVPMVVVGVDVLTTNRITNSIRTLVFGESNTQTLEVRDRLWAGALAAAGLLLILWGLWELIRSRAVVEANRDRIRLELAGPFGRPTRIDWEMVEDLGAGVVDDAGTELPVLWLRLKDLGEIPARPWGARRLDDHTVAILAVDWEIGAETVAEKLVEIAIARAGDEEAGDPGAGPE
jgi:hypothetical protein